MLDVVLVISVLALLAISLAFIIGCSVLDPADTGEWFDRSAPAENWEQPQASDTDLVEGVLA
jgi:hypothetical protein